MWSTPRWTAALLASATLAVAADALPHLVGKQSNFTITDMSPMIVYAPSASGPIDTAWNQTYVNMSWADYTPLYPATGMYELYPASWHSTQLVGASASIKFLGTAIYLYGTASGSFTVDVGGKSTSHSLQMASTETGLLAAVTGLDNVAQQATLTLNGGQVSLALIVVTLELGGNGATLENTTYSAIRDETTAYYPSENITWSSEMGDNEWKANGTMSGEWSNATSQGSSTWTVPRVQTTTPGASFILKPPVGTSFISMRTTTGSGEGSFNVTIDPPLFTGQATTSYTQGNPWLADNAVTMFFTPLDFRNQYTLKVVFTGSAGQYLNMIGGRIVTTTGGDMSQPGVTNSTGSGVGGNSGSGSSSNGNSTNGGSSNSGTDSNSSKTPVGAIAGGIAGGVVVIAALLLFFCLRRRKQQRTDDSLVPLAQTRKHNRSRWGRRPASGLSNFEIDASDKQIYVADGNASRASLHSLTEDENNIVPLTIVTPAAAPGPTAAEQKAREAARERRAHDGSRGTSDTRSHNTSYPPSSSGYSTAKDTQNSHSQLGKPALSSELGSQPVSSVTSTFRTYDSHNGHVQAPAQHGNQPQSDYAYSYSQHHSDSSPVSPGAGNAHAGAPWNSFSGAGHANPNQNHNQNHNQNPFDSRNALAPLAHHDEVAEEVDAGRVPQPKEAVPPRYNPAWVNE